MKHTIFILGIGSCILLSSCENKSSTALKELLPHYEVMDNKDTVNYLDVNGLKQGHWILFEVGLSNVNVSITLSPDSVEKRAVVNCQSGKCKIEEGFYKNDKKIGLWKSFNSDGTVKDSVDYKISSS
jgi:antitoxin component YwqK of YwqJK toxin-antitoxin module